MSTHPNHAAHRDAHTHLRAWVCLGLVVLWTSRGVDDLKFDDRLIHAGCSALRAVGAVAWVACAKVEYFVSIDQRVTDE